MLTPSKETILFMLRDWIKQRPGLEPMNYGDASSYRSELRSITKDRHIAEQFIRFVELRPSITAEHLLGGFRAFSGRLKLEPHPNKPDSWTLSYCTGQYWPTEYRRAVCAVLASVIWDYFRDNSEPDGFAVECYDEGRERVRATSKTWPTRAEAQAYADTVAQSRHPYVVELHGKMTAGDYLRKTCAREFGRTIGARFFN